MNILALETATPACAVGLLTRGEVYEVVLDHERHHTEFLVPGLAALLEDAGLVPAQLDRIVVDRGPGLFTGLRVGLATALGLSLATGVALVAVTSLELLAAGAARDGERGELVALVDGRRGEVFAQRFGLDHVPRALDEPRVARPEDVVAELVERGATLTGDGAGRYRGLFERWPILDATTPPVREALELGRTRHPVSDVTPLYLREADAVANFSTRERRGT